MAKIKPSGQLVICIDNSGYEVSLERRKIYEVVRDPAAEQLDQLRVVDESGEDYLYPKELFIAAQVPEKTHRVILQAA